MSCAECGVNVPKYTCPKCDTKTCSLDCCRQHKNTRDCDGVRPTVPQFVPIRGYSAFSERLSVEDQCFLSAVRARTYSKKALKRLKCARPKQPQPSAALNNILGSDGEESTAAGAGAGANGGADLTSVLNGATTSCPTSAFAQQSQQNCLSPAKIPPLMDLSECLSAMIGDNSAAESPSSRVLAGAITPQSSTANVSCAHRLVLSNARQRRIWLSVEDGNDCGETRYDRFSETIFWTVKLEFMRRVRREEKSSPISLSVKQEESERTGEDGSEMGFDLPPSTAAARETTSVSALAVRTSLVDYEDDEAEEGEVCEMEMDVKQRNVTATFDPQSRTTSITEKEDVVELDSVFSIDTGGPLAEEKEIIDKSDSLKSKESTTAAKAEDVPWTMEPIVKTDESTNTVERQEYTVHNIPETLTVATLVRQFVRPKAVGGALVSAADLDMAKMRPFIDAATVDHGLMIYMRVPCGDTERYYVVDPTLTVLDNLRNRYVLGHPTLIVTLGGDFDEFRTLTEADARELRDKFRPGCGMGAYSGGGSNAQRGGANGNNFGNQGRRQSQPHMWNLRSNGGGGGGRYSNHHNNHHPYNNQRGGNFNNSYGNHRNSNNGNYNNNYRSNNSSGGGSGYRNNNGNRSGGGNNFNLRGGRGRGGASGGGGRGYNNSNNSARGHVDLDAVLEDPNFGAESIA